MTASKIAVPAAQILISIVPIVGIIMGAALLFFYLLWRHKEIMYQIKNNTYISKNYSVYNILFLMGIMLVFLGIILTLLFLLIEGLSYALLGGLIPLAVGMSFLVFFFFAKWNNWESPKI